MERYVKSQLLLSVKNLSAFVVHTPSLKLYTLQSRYENQTLKLSRKWYIIRLPSKSHTKPILWWWTTLVFWMCSGVGIGQQDCFDGLLIKKFTSFSLARQ